VHQNKTTAIARRRAAAAAFEAEDAEAFVLHYGVSDARADARFAHFAAIRDAERRFWAFDSGRAYVAADDGDSDDADDDRAFDAAYARVDSYHFRDSSDEDDPADDPLFDADFAHRDGVDKDWE
jgi:hypothetical protein